MGIKKLFSSSFINNFREGRHQLLELILDFIVFFSSIFFLFWFSTILITQTPIFNLFELRDVLFVTLIFVLIILSIYYHYDDYYSIRLYKDKKFQKITNYLKKIVNIVGSIFVLFLFLNLYFEISILLKQQLLNIYEVLEDYFNIFVLVFLFLMIGSLVLFVISVLITRFLGKNIFKNFNQEQLLGLLAIVLCILIIILTRPLQNLSFSEVITVYSKLKLKWLFGFSLVFLHVNYLIKEVKTLLKNPENRF